MIIPTQSKLLINSSDNFLDGIQNKLDNKVIAFILKESTFFRNRKKRNTNFDRAFVLIKMNQNVSNNVNNC